MADIEPKEKIPGKKRKRRVPVLVIAVVIFVVLVVSGIVLFYGHSDNINELLKGASEDVAEILNGTNEYYAACIAIESGNLDFCDNLNSEITIRHCNNFVRMYEYDKIVLERNCNEMATLGDPSLAEERISLCEKVKSGSCSGIGYNVYVKYCNCLLNKDMESCIDEDTTKDDIEIDILTYYALKNNNPSECNGISYFYARNFCKGVVTNCSSAFIKDWAYLAIARDLNNFTLCDNVVNSEIKDLCVLEWLNFTEAIKELFL